MTDGPMIEKARSHLSKHVNPLHSPVQYWAWHSLCVLCIVFPVDELSALKSGTAGFI